jgi:hypothetical protein
MPKRPYRQSSDDLMAYIRRMHETWDAIDRTPPGATLGERFTHGLKKIGRQMRREAMFAFLFALKLVIVPLTYFVILALVILAI